MIVTFLAKLLLARNPALTIAHAQRIAKVGLIAAAVVLAVCGFLLWDWADDRAAVREHEAARVEAALQSERRASAADVTRRAAAQAESAATVQELETIHDADPQAAAAPAGAGTRAVSGRLRHR